MPTYEYECRTNGHRFEVKQSFSEDPLTECTVCGEPVRKVFSAAGIVFKGSGYYVTDSRSGGPKGKGEGKGKEGADSGGKSGGEGGSSGGDGGAKADGGGKSDGGGAKSDGGGSPSSSTSSSTSKAASGD